MMTNVVARASHIAAGQWGLLTTAQAVHEGISRLQLARLADAGVLQRVGRGVYATTSSAAEHLSLRAAWLALDPAHTAELRLVNPIAAGVVSHASAAGLHQLADLLRAGHDPEHVAQIIGQGIRRGVVDLTDLAAHLDPLARRHNQPDGSGLVEYLLDIVGLSQAALARELAQSPAGQGLLAAGRLSAIAEMVASISPQINVSQLLGPDKLDFGKNAGLSETFALQRSMAAVQPAPDSRTDR